MRIDKNVAPKCKVKIEEKKLFGLKCNENGLNGFKSKVLNFLSKLFNSVWCMCSQDGIVLVQWISINLPLSLFEDITSLFIIIVVVIVHFKELNNAKKSTTIAFSLVRTLKEEEKKKLKIRIFWRIFQKKVLKMNV